MRKRTTATRLPTERSFLIRQQVRKPGIQPREEPGEEPGSQVILRNIRDPKGNQEARNSQEAMDPSVSKKKLQGSLVPVPSKAPLALAELGTSPIGNYLTPISRWYIGYQQLK